MSIYSVSSNINSGALTQTEISEYGSSRLGVWNLNRNATSIQRVDFTAYSGSFTRGNKVFELSNHLGNVLVTISDKKIGHDAGNGVIDYYNADVVTANDYYPFGMQMPGRKFSQANSSYRYGFNGKEQDKETTTTTTYDYGFRIYNPALGRFLSVDPLGKCYPQLTPYQFASNTPIQAIDLDGLELYYSTSGKLLGKFGTDLSIRIVEDKKVIKEIKDQQKISTSSNQEFLSFKLGSNTLNEIIRQYDAASAAKVPVGEAAIIDAKDNLIFGESKKAIVAMDKSGAYYATTPENLPSMAIPTSQQDRDNTTIIHSHPIPVFEFNPNNGTFNILEDGYVIPNFAPLGQKFSTYIINVDNPSQKMSSSEPSSVDKEASLNGNSFNLVIVGLITPNKLVDSNPMSSGSPKKVAMGKSGANFYKNTFGDKIFSLTGDALKLIQKDAQDQKDKAAAAKTNSQ